MTGIRALSTFEPPLVPISRLVTMSIMTDAQRTLRDLLPDMPVGAALVPLGLLLLFFAGIDAVRARTDEPSQYHPLATLHGVVTDVYRVRPRDNATGSDVCVVLDTMPGTPRVRMFGPGLLEADQRMRALTVGARITVEFDGWQQGVWALERADGEPGFGVADVKAWLAEAHADDHRTAKWFLAGGVLAVVAGVVAMARDSS